MKLLLAKVEQISTQKTMLYIITETEKINGGKAGYASGLFVVNKNTIETLVTTTTSFFDTKVSNVLQSIFKCNTIRNNNLKINSDLSDYKIKENISYLMLIKSNEHSPLELEDTDSNGVSIESYLIANKIQYNDLSYKIKPTNIEFGIPELILDSPDFVKGVVDIQYHPVLYPELSDAKKTAFNITKNTSFVKEIMYYCKSDLSKFGHPYRIFVLHGAPGTGKTELVNCIADELGYPLVTINCNSRTTLNSIIQEMLPIPNASGEVKWTVQDSMLTYLLELGVPFTLKLDELNKASPEFQKNFSSAWTDGMFTLGTRIIQFNPNIINVFCTYNPSASQETMMEESFYSRCYMYRRELRKLEDKIEYIDNIFENDSDDTIKISCNIPEIQVVISGKNKENDIDIYDKADVSSIKILPTRIGEVINKHIVVYADGIEIPKDKINKNVIKNTNELLITNRIYEYHSKNIKNNLKRKHTREIMNVYNKLLMHLKDEGIKDISIRNKSIDGMLCHYDDRAISKFISDIFFYKSVGYTIYSSIKNNIQDTVTRIKSISTFDSETPSVEAKTTVEKLTDDIERLQKILFDIPAYSEKEYDYELNKIVSEITYDIANKVNESISTDNTSTTITKDTEEIDDSIQNDIFNTAIGRI